MRGKSRHTPHPKSSERFGGPSGKEANETDFVMRKKKLASMLSLQRNEQGADARGMD